MKKPRSWAKRNPLRMKFSGKWYTRKGTTRTKEPALYWQKKWQEGGHYCRIRWNGGIYVLYVRPMPKKATKKKAK